LAENRFYFLIMAKVEFKNVSKVYQDSKDDRKILSLKDISFLVNPGEIMVLIGPSGCGKTTILNLIAGFIQPTEGKVLFNGQPVTGPGAERTIIFQEYILFPWYSVRNNIEFGLTAKKVPKQERRRISDELLSLVDLERFADFYPHQLSGGMKQRVALARALAVNPEVLLMDEPFGSLDEQVRRFLQQSLLKIWRVKRPTIIFVTHSIGEALILGHKILVLSCQPAEERDYIEINKPFPRDLVRDLFFQDIKIRIHGMLQEEFKKGKKC